MKIAIADNTGLRYDAGKAPMHLLPWDTLLELSHIYGRGAEKYAPHNWEKGMDYSKVFNSMIRHAAAFQSGEDFDKESEQMHMLHVAWNAIALATYQLRKIGHDDRFIFAAIAEQNAEAVAPVSMAEIKALFETPVTSIILDDPINRDTALPKEPERVITITEEQADAPPIKRALIEPVIDKASPRKEFMWKDLMLGLGTWIQFNPGGDEWVITSIDGSSFPTFPTFTVQHATNGRTAVHIPAHIHDVVR